MVAVLTTKHGFSFHFMLFILSLVFHVQVEM